MDELLSTNWGDIVGAVSLVVTLGGFGIAIYQATKARKAADAAEVASRESMEAIAQVLIVADLQRAIAGIQRLKDLHRDMRWETSLEHYQALRAVLADISARHPTFTSEQRAFLQTAIQQVVVIENSVDEALRDRVDPSGATRFNEDLNDIQVQLEEIASSTFPGREAS